MIRKSIVVAVVALPLVLLAFSPLNYRFVDDAYISFRYSRNLAHGLGLVFNQGEYVEGFTNLLWTLMFTIPEWLGLRVDMTAFWLGIGFGFLALREAVHLAKLLRTTPRAQAISVLMLALYPSFWRASGYGLEAGLLAFLVTRTVCLAITPKPAGAGVTAGLLFLTRPDTLMVGPLVALYEISRFSSASNSRSGFVDQFKREALPVVAWWAAIVGMATVWRLLYYDAWLPNTLADKSLPISFTRETLRFVYSNAREGMAYWAGFLYSALPLTIGSLLAVALNPKDRAVWLCIGVLGLQLPVVMMNAGDWMQHHRLLAPYAPLLTGLFAVGVDGLIEMPSSRRKRSVEWLSGAVIIILAAATMLGDHQWIRRPQLLALGPPSCFETLAKLMRPVLLSGDRVSPEVLGIFSYRLPDIYVHDFQGLTDRRIATEGTLYLRQYGKAYPSYTYNVVRPHVIIVQSGFGHLRPMAEAAAGHFNETYSTYSLEKVPGCFAGVLVSIRTDVKTRILSAFNGVELKQVLVTSTRDES